MGVHMRWWEIPDWWVAIGTMLAVLVALFGDRWKRWLFPPRFSIALKSPSGEPTPVTLTAPDGTTSVQKGRYYHLEVGNKGTIATNAAVYLISIMLPSAGGGWHQNWRGEVPFTWRHAELHGAFRSIGLTPVDADVVSLVKDKWVELCVLIRPNALPYSGTPSFPGRWRGEMKMVITVQVKASEGQSNPQLFLVAWDGLWEDGDEEIKRHLRIVPIRSVADA